MSTTYNGWRNYETWATNLQFDNCFEDVAEEYRDNVSGFADYIQEVVEESMPQVDGLASDLLNAAMSEVDWHEIAQGYLDELPDVEEEEEEEEEEAV